jgi:L-threonylcarbamoyladenylate synthase
MDTKVLRCDPTAFDPSLLEDAANLIRNGDIVAFPTETVYGLGANALDAQAVAKIFQAKSRPADNPLIVHISAIEQITLLSSNFPSELKEICERFWPGPLTIVVPRSKKVPDIVTAGLDTVAVRFPAHPIARALIQLAGVPIAAPSANVSGRPSPTSASHVLTDLDGKIPYLIDGGSAAVGVESTVIDYFHSPPLILRPGGVTLEQLQRYLPDIRPYDKKKDGGLDLRPSTPGMKYRHYAPNTPLILFIGEPDPMHQYIEETALNALAEGRKVIILQTHPDHPYYFGNMSKSGISLISMGSANEPAQIAAQLFHQLRTLDQYGADLILVEGIEEKNEGLAVMNRLRKAASKIIPVE